RPARHWQCTKPALFCVYLKNMPRFKIHHVTKYTYEVPVRDSANQVILFPVKDDYQEVLKQELAITGEPAVDIYKDYYGNDVGSFMYAEPHSELLIDSRIEVVTKQRPAPEDKDAKEKQWDYLQKIRFQVPYIDFLKQEQVTALAEVKKQAQSEECVHGTP